MFYDTLDQLRHLIYHSLVRNRDKPYFEKGAITLFWVVILRCSMVIKSGVSGKVNRSKIIIT